MRQTGREGRDLFGTATLPKSRAKPGKGKRNRLTDARCAWKHMSAEEKAIFLAEVTN